MKEAEDTVAVFFNLITSRENNIKHQTFCDKQLEKHRLRHNILLKKHQFKVGQCGIARGKCDFARGKCDFAQGKCDTAQGKCDTAQRKWYIAQRKCDVAQRQRHFA